MARKPKPQIEILAEWTDDHLPCANLAYGELRFSLWWTDHETLAALMYAADSKRARAQVAGLLALLATKTQADIDATEEVKDEETEDEWYRTDWGLIQPTERGIG
jgi:hypothetical protein